MPPGARVATLPCYKKNDIESIGLKAGGSGRNVRLFAGEVVHGHGIFEEGIIPGDDGDAAFGDEIALPVGFSIVANRSALGNVDVAVKNRLADTATTPDAYVREQNAVIDVRVRVNANVG